MNDLYELSMPWWHFVLRGAVTYLGLLLLMRLSGKRTFGEMSPFDIAVLMLVGGALRGALVGEDTSLLAGFIAVSTILALDKLLAFAAARSPALDRLLEGVPVLLAKDGKAVPGALRRHDLAPAAFERELRMHGVEGTGEVRAARLEPNGRVSVVKMHGRG